MFEAKTKTFRSAREDLPSLFLCLLFALKIIQVDLAGNFNSKAPPPSTF
jgi:hypothetical protein